MVISLFSMLMLMRPTSFALLYSTGNVVSLAATGFLIGPKRQLRSAFAKKRVLATVLFLGAIAATLAVALTLHSTILCIVFIIIQFCALVWYTASYIPFAQAAISSAVKSCFARGGG